MLIINNVNSSDGSSDLINALIPSIEMNSVPSQIKRHVPLFIYILREGELRP